MKYKKINSNDFVIPPNALVTLTYMGNLVELQYMSNFNNRQRTEKLSESEYVVLSTGEIKEYKTEKAATKNQTIESVRKTMRKIRLLVQTNVTDRTKVRWVTLTYKKIWRTQNGSMKTSAGSTKNFLTSSRPAEWNARNISPLQSPRGAAHGIYISYISGRAKKPLIWTTASYAGYGGMGSRR